MDAVDLGPEMNFAATLANQIGRMFPKLAGAELGIEEPLDQRGFGFLLCDAAGAFRGEGLLEEMHHHAREREPLDALRAPFGADFIARHTPDFFGVRLEKSKVKLLAEAVDDEILERVFLALRQQRRAHVTEAATNGTIQAQIPEGGCRQADGIVEEAAQKINAALALPHQHDQIFRLRIRSHCGRGSIALLPLIAKLAIFVRVGRTASADGHQVQPPAHDAVRLRKEAMAANIHAVALVANGPRDAADLLTGLEPEWA